MGRQWEKWTENQVIKLEQAADRPAEAWSAFLYCRKAIPDGEEWEEFRNSVNARMVIGMWGVVSDIVAALTSDEQWSAEEGNDAMDNPTGAGPGLD